MRDELDSVKLARIDERVITMSRWQEQHHREDEQRDIDTNARFERTFGYLKDEFTKMNARFDKTDAKIEERLKPTEDKVSDLWDDKNVRVGAVNLGRFISGTIGGVIVALVEFFRNSHGGGPQ